VSRSQVIGSRADGAKLTLSEAALSPFDLVIQAGRVLCPVTGVDSPGAVAVIDGRIAAVGHAGDGPAHQTLRLPHAVLLPGLVDLHAHPARGGSRYGVDPDRHLLPFGTTTVLAQGEAGADNVTRYQMAVIAPSLTRVLLAINIGRRGEATIGGACEASEDVDATACVKAVHAARRHEGHGIWGIAVNVSQATCGRTDPRVVMAAGLEAAEETGLPLLFGPRRAEDWALREQLLQLRPGDVVTYCFSDCPEGLVAGDRIRDEVWAARARGIRFDVGHGMGSFSFRVAEHAVSAGFLPDAISTDRYQRHLGLSPRHDLPRTLSKLLAVGMTERDVFARVTAWPAAILGLGGEVGSLAPGAAADLSALAWNPRAASLRDTSGAERPGGAWEPVLTVRGGVVVRPTSTDAGAPP
jgi:dihydroorotase